LIQAPPPPTAFPYTTLFRSFEKLKSAFEAAEKQKQTIDALQSARSTPAWFLHELSNILTPDHQPTMTPEMARRVREDPNRAWVQDRKSTRLNSSHVKISYAV